MKVKDLVARLSLMKTPARPATSRQELLTNCHQGGQGDWRIGRAIEGRQGRLSTHAWSIGVRKGWTGIKRARRQFGARAEGRLTQAGRGGL
jgi:hypothetical protein